MKTAGKIFFLTMLVLVTTIHTRQYMNYGCYLYKYMNNSKTVSVTTIRQ